MDVEQEATVKQKKELLPWRKGTGKSRRNLAAVHRGSKSGWVCKSGLGAAIPGLCPEAGFGCSIH